MVNHFRQQTDYTLVLPHEATTECTVMDSGIDDSKRIIVNRFCYTMASYTIPIVGLNHTKKRESRYA